jgi:hypothetical protein
MFPRYSPLESWEWQAVHDRLEAGGPGMSVLLPSLLQLHLLARHSDFARRNRLFAPEIQARISLGGATERAQTTARLEHRLYTLFAE